MGVLHPRIGGTTWMAEIAPFGDVVRSFGINGCLQAQFAMAPRVKHRALVPGALLDLVGDGGVDWSGVVSEVDPVEGMVYAHGFGAEAAKFLALNSVNHATSTPSVAVDQWGVRAAVSGTPAPLGRSGVPTTAYTAAADGVNTVAGLLEANANELAQWWTIGADRIVRMAAAPVEPVWQVPPGVVDLSGAADDDYVSALQVTFLDIAGYASVVVPDLAAAKRLGYREESVDATPLGVITSARATAIAQGVLLKGRSRLGWTQSVELSKYDLLTMGYQPADLSMVNTLQKVRFQGIDDDLQALTGLPYLDALIGEVNWADGSPTISLSPVGAVVQTFDEVIAKMVGK